MRPGEHPRRILLAVVGQSPQILTETVYALARSVPPADRFVPTEVQVLTTQAGAARLAERLLSPPSHVWRQLVDDHALGTIDFDETHIHLVVAADGRPLDDIRTAADNAAMADAVSERVRLLTADPDCALHVSLAGGRKTMGYYAGYALSLFGRSQDRLSHVLVDPVYEAAPDFHYPTPRRRMLRTRDGSAEVDASRAQVELAQIPYVRLRSLLPPAMLNAPSSFAGVVDAARIAQQPPRMRLDVGRSRLLADGQTLELTPTAFALLAVLAQRARAGKPPLRAPLRDTHDAQWADEVLADLQAAVGVMNVDSRVAESLARDCAGTKISPQWSRLRRALHAQLAPARVALYFDDGATHRHKRYRVPLPAEAIDIVRPDDRRDTEDSTDCKLAAQRAPKRRGHTRPQAEPSTRTRPRNES